MKRALNLTPDDKLEVKKSCPDVEPDGIDDQLMDENWQTVGPSKAKQDADPKEGKGERTVYVKGVEPNPGDLAKEAAYKKAGAFKLDVYQLVGTVQEMKIVGDTVRITCNTAEQANTLLTVTRLIGHDVTVTPPHSITANGQGQNKEGKWMKGVLKQVPTVVTNENIMDDTGAIWVHRITHMVDGTAQDTRTVIIAYHDSLPENVEIGFMTFQVHPYTPTPIRCNKCQKFGHKTNRCRQQQPTCPRCSQHHDVMDCTVSDQNERKCRNCGKAHSAAYKGCDKYKTVSKILSLSTTANCSYKEAAKAIAIQQREKPHTGHDGTTAHVRSGLSFAAATAGQQASTQSSSENPVRTGISKTALFRATTPPNMTDCSTQTDTSDCAVQTTSQTPIDITTRLEQQQSLFTQMARNMIEVMQSLVNTIPATDRNARQRHDAVTKFNLFASTIDSMADTKPTQTNLLHTHTTATSEQHPTPAGKKKNTATATTGKEETAVLRAIQNNPKSKQIKPGTTPSTPASEGTTK